MTYSWVIKETTGNKTIYNELNNFKRKDLIINEDIESTSKTSLINELGRTSTLIGASIILKQAKVFLKELIEDIQKSDMLKVFKEKETPEILDDANLKY